MTTSELNDEITAYVHNRVDENEYRLKAQHAENECADCGVQFEAEVERRLQSSVDADKGTRAQLPHAVGDGQPSADSGGRGPSSNGVDQPTHGRTWIARFESDWMSSGGVVIALAAIAGSLWVLGVFTPSKEAVLPGQELVEGEGVTKPVLASPINVLNQTTKNLQAVKRGELSVEHAEEDPVALREYFMEEGVGYGTDIPKASLPLSGGFVTAHLDKGKERKFAHWVYTREDERIVVFALPAAVLAEGTLFYLTPDALARLDSGERLWEDFGDGGTLCALRKGDVVYVVSSTLDMSDLRSSYPGL